MTYVSDFSSILYFDVMSPEPLLFLFLPVHWIDFLLATYGLIGLLFFSVTIRLNDTAYHDPTVWKHFLPVYQF